MTATGRFSAGLVEAACLAALVSLPVFFNPLSVRVFEPEKATLLRTLALLVVAVGLAGALAEPRRDGTRARGLPPAWSAAGWRVLALAVAAFVAATLLSTAFAVAPRASLHGSYARLQGTYTTLATVALFVGLVATIRRRAQVERVVLAMIVTSVPVALYAVLQRLGLDPQSWDLDPTSRTTSTFGNPIFLGGYLIMVLPLTVREAGLALAEPGSRWARGARALLALGIAGLQIVALAMSASRGPLAAGLVAAAFFVPALCVALGRRRRALAVLTLALLGVAGVVTTQLGGAGARGEGGALGRLAVLLDPTVATSQVRLLVWEGTARVVAPHEPLVDADGNADRWNALRTLVGHGPESLLFVFPRFYPPRLAQVESRDRLPDRAHDEIWDVLVNGGFVGLAAYLALVLAVFHLGFAGLGLAAGGRDGALLATLCAIGGALAVPTLVALAGWGLLGPGIAIGLTGGVFAYLAFAAAAPRAAGGAPRAETSLAAALTAAVLAHFVEIQVGIATVTSRLLFWTAAALLVALARGAMRTAPDAHRVPSARAAVRWGLLLALMLGTLAYALVLNAGSRTEPGAIVGTALRGGVGAVLLASWVVSALTVTLASRGGAPGAAAARFLALVLLVAAAGAGLFLAQHTRALAVLAREAPRSLDEVAANGIRLEELLVRHHLFALAVLPLLALSLWDAGPRPWRLSPRGPLLAAGATAVAVVALGGLAPLRADVALKSADRLAARGSWPETMAFHRRALALAPDEAQHWSMAARDLHEQAKQGGGDEAHRDALMTEALACAREAARREPLHPGHGANLGRLMLWWASATTDPALRARRGAEAEEYLGAAATQMPNHARVWNERAALHLQVLGSTDSGVTYARRAVELDPRYGPPHQLLGDLFTRLAAEQTSEEARAAAARQAAVEYEEALRLSSTSEMANPFKVRLTAGRLRARLGDTARAREHAGAALGLAASDDERASARALLRELAARPGGTG